MLKKFKFLNGVFIELKSEFVFEINELRCKYSIHFDQKSGIPTLYLEKNMMKKWPMEFHKYCVDLFRTTPDLEMIMNLNDSSDLHESQTIKDFYLYNSYENVDPKIAEEFFEKVDVQNSFSTVRQSLEGPVSDDSKLWNIPNLFLSSSWVRARQLTRFTGKNAYLVVRDHNDISQDMNAFLKHWLNSDNTKLETMIIRGYRSITEELFDGIQTSRWDSKKRAARYISSASFERVLKHHSGEGCKFENGLNFNIDYLDCTDASDIVRESDGLIASVKVHNCFFFMFVWHSRFS
ncbi:unnamed protein product [Caenorhabditis nigoni]